MTTRSHKKVSIVILIVLFLPSFLITISSISLHSETYNDARSERLDMDRCDFITGIQESTGSDVIPQWSDLKIGTIFVETQEAPQPSADPVPGTNITIEDLEFVRENSTNATNLSPGLDLFYIERFNVSVSDTYQYEQNGSRPVYHPSITRTSNTYYIKIRSNKDNVVEYKNDEDLTKNIFPLSQTILAYSTDQNKLKINVTLAADLVDNSTLDNNSWFYFEIASFLMINIKNWTIKTMTNSSQPGVFGIEAYNSSHIVNYSQTFSFDTLNPIKARFILIPADKQKWINPKFYYNDEEFTPGNYYDPINGSIIGWRIPNQAIPTNTSSTLNITFGINYTIRFTDMYSISKKWAEDRLVQGTDNRVRKYHIEITEGAEHYLVEKIYFNITEMKFKNAADLGLKSHSYPVTGTNLRNNTYSVFDPAIEDIVLKENGTKFEISRLKKGIKVSVSFLYNASYNISLRILDEVKNPLAGAEVILYYEGVRFGPKMNETSQLNYPIQVSDQYGYVHYNYLPMGNFEARVSFNGKSVTNFTFSTFDQDSGSALNVETPVPYRPAFMVGWFAVFSSFSIASLVILRFKKK
ncbi:MAG: hypothetical protein ACTSXP_12260 [Promethearchaeota archaeon]